MNQFLYILLGLTLIIGGNFAVTLAVVSLYFLAAKIKEPFLYVLKLTLWLSFINVFIQFLGLIFLSSYGIWMYVVSIFVLAVAGYFGVLRLAYKFHIFEVMIISLSLAIILNPVWLRLFGLIL